MKDYYQILEVPLDASAEKIKEQYRFLVHAWHPDKFPNPDQKAKAQEKIQAINAAYKILSDPAQRQRYDREQAAARLSQEASQRQRALAEFERQQQERNRADYEQKERAEQARQQAAHEQWQKEQAKATPQTQAPQPRPQKTSRRASAAAEKRRRLFWGIALVVGVVGALGLWVLYSPNFATPSITLSPTPQTETPASTVGPTADLASSVPPNTPVKLTPQIVLATKTPTAIRAPSTAKVSAIYVGTDTTCALRADRQVQCWGLKIFEPSGQGSVTGYEPPKALAWGTEVTSIAIAPYHLCVLTAQGGVMCGGYDFGLGNLTGPEFEAKTVQAFASDNVAIGASPDEAGPTCALSQAGSVKCLVGIGGSAQPISGFTSIQALAVGGLHVCGLTTTSGVKCWGSNTHGELGNGTTARRRSTVAVDVLGLEQGVRAIAAGKDHTCALTADGQVKCWGSNAHGQLGDGSIIDQNIPVTVKGLTNVTAIAAGAWHTCALTATGGVKCWGENSDGRLGDGTTINHNTLVDVAGLSKGIVAIAAGGGGHTCALTAQGGVKCWGESLYGEVGDGSPSSSWVTLPVDVVGLNP